MINEELRIKAIDSISSYVYNNRDLLNDPLLSNGSFKTSCIEYYFYYPYLFSSSFENIEPIKLEQLNIASYFCYRYVVLNDDIIDQQVSSDLVLKHEMMANCYMKHALEILHKLFDQESLFWVKWELRKKELKSTILLDKSLDATNYTEEIFKEYAWNKSGFSKLAIDAMYILSGAKNETVYQSLLSSHKEFCCAMQLHDDLFDVVEDQVNPQFNFAKYLIYEELAKSSIQRESLSNEEIENYLFVSGKGSQVLNIALQHIVQARELANPCFSEAWDNVLQFYKRIFVIEQRSLDTYLKKIVAEQLNSNLLLFENRVDLSSGYIEVSLKKGLSFIFNRRNANGSWTDYLTSAGSSDVWATGFIVTMIKDLLDKDSLDRAIDFLHKSASPYWGYREGYINDIDSINFALLSIGSTLKDTAGIDFLYKWQNLDGGMPTYPSINIEKLRKAMNGNVDESYAGWIQSHPCVTSVSFYLLNTIQHEANNSRLVAIEDYFQRQFEGNQKIAYWWTNDLYAIYFLILSYKFIRSEDFKLILEKRLSDIIHECNSDGSVGDGFIEKSAFYTSFLTLSMIELYKVGVSDFKIRIQKSILWLLKNQLDDGSWKETNGLQIPQPNCLTPVTNNWPVSEYGCNVRSFEFNRLFTTSVCLKAINAYNEIKF
ncbi:MAG: hypothetical protein EAZ13_02795 [Sphingobacteriia bacterium]|nr:MAG: hypothetical protein EAZ13_02795 [Sphingobacteriia bacterium]